MVCWWYVKMMFVARELWSRHEHLTGDEHIRPVFRPATTRRRSTERRGRWQSSADDWSQRLDGGERQRRVEEALPRLVHGLLFPASLYRRTSAVCRTMRGTRTESQCWSGCCINRRLSSSRFADRDQRRSKYHRDGFGRTFRTSICLLLVPICRPVCLLFVHSGVPRGARGHEQRCIFLLGQLPKCTFCALCLLFQTLFYCNCVVIDVTSDD